MVNIPNINAEEILDFIKKSALELFLETINQRRDAINQEIKGHEFAVKYEEELVRENDYFKFKMTYVRVKGRKDKKRLEIYAKYELIPQFEEYDVTYIKAKDERIKKLKEIFGTIFEDIRKNPKKAYDEFLRVVKRKIKNEFLRTFEESLEKFFGDLNFETNVHIEISEPLAPWQDVVIDGEYWKEDNGFLKTVVQRIFETLEGQKTGDKSQKQQNTTTTNREEQR